jgi:hypothetical protein
MKFTQVLKAKDGRYHIVYKNMIGKTQISVMSFYSKVSAQNFLARHLKFLLSK